MRTTIGILAVLGLLTLFGACNKNSESGSGNDIQREQAPVGGDDLRETDSYRQAIPIDNDKNSEE